MKRKDTTQTKSWYLNKVGNVCTNLNRWKDYDTWSHFTAINESMFNKDATVDLTKPIEEQPANI
jgi:hypothetical protein